MIKKTGSQGFTLIELLVVIAIIGILASVVLASLNTARTRAADAAIKANLANVRAQAALYYESGNTFATADFPEGACATGETQNVFADTVLMSAIEASVVQSGGTLAANTACAASAESWAIAVTYRSDPLLAYCVDNSGATKDVTITTIATDAILGDGSEATPFICG